MTCTCGINQLLIMNVYNKKQLFVKVLLKKTWEKGAAVSFPAAPSVMDALSNPGSSISIYSKFHYYQLHDFRTHCPLDKSEYI